MKLNYDVFHVFDLETIIKAKRSQTKPNEAKRSQQQIFEYFVSLKNKPYMFRAVKANKKGEAIDVTIKDNIDSNNAEHLPLFDVLNAFDGSLYSCKLCKQASSDPFGTVHFYKHHNVDEYYTVVKETLEVKRVTEATREFHSSETGKIDPLERLKQVMDCKSN